MWINDNKHISNIIEQNGNNIYAAILSTARTARELSSSTNSMLSDSTALSWAITGEKPIQADRVIKEYNPKLNSIQELLCCIDDNSIRDSVYLSYTQSLNAGHLIYCYSDELESGYEDKVRILVNMAWYKMLENN